MLSMIEDMKTGYIFVGDRVGKKMGAIKMDLESYENFVEKESWKKSFVHGQNLLRLDWN